MKIKKCKCGHIKLDHKLRRGFGVICETCCANDKLLCSEICREFKLKGAVNKMKHIIVVMLLMLAVGTAQASPLPYWMDRSRPLMYILRSRVLQLVRHSDGRPMIIMDSR